MAEEPHDPAAAGRKYLADIAARSKSVKDALSVPENAELRGVDEQLKRLQDLQATSAMAQEGVLGSSYYRAAEAAESQKSLIDELGKLGQERAEAEAARVDREQAMVGALTGLRDAAVIQGKRDTFMIRLTVVLVAIGASTLIAAIIAAVH